MLITGDNCVDGFLSLDYLELFLTKNFNSKVMVPYLGSVNIIPLGRFSSGGSISLWAVPRSKDLELQIWRLVSDGETDEYYMQVNSSMADTENVRIGMDCQYIIEQPIAFQEGDILAVNSDLKVVLHDILMVSSGEEDLDQPCSEEDKLSDIINITLYIGKTCRGGKEGERGRGTMCGYSNPPCISFQSMTVMSTLTLSRTLLTPSPSFRRLSLGLCMTITT